MTAVAIEQELLEMMGCCGAVGKNAAVEDPVTAVINDDIKDAEQEDWEGNSNPGNGPAPEDDTEESGDDDEEFVLEVVELGNKW